MKTHLKHQANGILNTDAISMTAIAGLIELDETLIGTKDYMGVDYFWAHEYRHLMRPMPYGVRRRVHKALIKAGLDVSGESPEHLEVIYRSLGPSRLAWLNTL
jgi:hypothetical protein